MASRLPPGMTTLGTTNRAAIFFLNIFFTSLFKDSIRKTDFEMYTQHSPTACVPKCIKTPRCYFFIRSRKRAIGIVSLMGSTRVGRARTQERCGSWEKGLQPKAAPGSWLELGNTWARQGQSGCRGPPPSAWGHCRRSRIGVKEPLPSLWGPARRCPLHSVRVPDTFLHPQRHPSVKSMSCAQPYT